MKTLKFSIVKKASERKWNAARAARKGAKKGMKWVRWKIDNGIRKFFCALCVVEWREESMNERQEGIGKGKHHSSSSVYCWKEKSNHKPWCGAINCMLLFFSIQIKSPGDNGGWGDECNSIFDELLCNNHRLFTVRNFFYQINLK